LRHLNVRILARPILTHIANAKFSTNWDETDYSVATI
jgi:hypothetical protein